MGETTALVPIENTCLRCSVDAGKPLGINARCEACERDYREHRPSHIWKVVRATPLALGGALAFGIFAAFAGATLGLGAVGWFALGGAAAGGAFGGRFSHRTLERRRRTRFLREPVLPEARLLSSKSDAG